jgi:hypothetical protein
MNITPLNNQLPIATVVNPATDTLRRDNNVREVISQPAAASQSAADKGVASERDKGKNPGQLSAEIDFANIIKKAEEENNEIGDSPQDQKGSSGSDGQADQNNPQAEQNKQQATQDKQQIEQEKAKAEVVEQQVTHLKARDAEVRAHELAHASVGGAAAGAPSYDFKTGPDGRRYAVGGEVSIDISEVKGDPRATIAKMNKVKAAALAPVDPSGQDKRIAATATTKIQQAHADLVVENNTESSTSASKENLRVDSADDSGTKSALGSGDELDNLFEKTLAAQEQIAPSRSLQVENRASRVEGFYATINHAYEKPSGSNFQLTA